MKYTMYSLYTTFATQMLIVATAYNDLEMKRPFIHDLILEFPTLLGI